MGEKTTALRSSLYWGKEGHSTCTVPIDADGSNVARFSLSPGYKAFHEYCEQAEFDHSPEEEYDPLTAAECCITCDDAQVISDNEGDDEPKTRWVSCDKNDAQMTFDVTPNTIPESDKPNVIVDEEDRLAESKSAELLRLHYKFGHTPFSKLQETAKQGIIPKRLAKCQVPVCSACQYAKATKRPWRGKTRKDHN